MPIVTEHKKLDGEGDVERIERVRVRKICEVCGERLAVLKQTYLLIGTRSNPASSAYGKDDCSWCEDAHVFMCDECSGCSAATPEGYVSCSVFKCGDRFASLFLEWKETREEG